MKIIKDYEIKLKRIWSQAQEAQGNKKQELISEYQRVYRSYKIQLLIVQG